MAEEQKQKEEKTLSEELLEDDLELETDVESLPL
jgi:hypothetical protein